MACIKHFEFIIKTISLRAPVEALWDCWCAAARNNSFYLRLLDFAQFRNIFCDNYTRKSVHTHKETVYVFSIFLVGEYVYFSRFNPKLVTAGHLYKHRETGGRGESHTALLVRGHGGRPSRQDWPE